MKCTTSIPALLLSALLAATFSGCASTVDGDAVESKPSGKICTTKGEVYHIYGMPDSIRYDEGDQYLYYRFSRTRGGGFGLGNALFQILMIDRRHSAENTLIFKVNPEGRVVSVDYLIGTEILRRSIWPFGA